MSFRGWDVDPENDPEDYDSLVNIQPETGNPHDETDSKGEYGAYDVSELVNVSEFSKEELYWNAMRASETLTERYEETGEYFMVQFDPCGAVPVVMGDRQQLLFHDAYDPLTFDNDFSPLEYISNTKYANELMGGLLNSRAVDLMDQDIDFVEEDWRIPYEVLAGQSEMVIAAPGLEDRYREMVEERLL